MKNTSKLKSLGVRTLAAIMTATMLFSNGVVVRAEQTTKPVESDYTTFDSEGYEKAHKEWEESEPSYEEWLIAMQNGAETGDESTLETMHAIQQAYADSLGVPVEVVVSEEAFDAWQEANCPKKSDYMIPNPNYDEEYEEWQANKPEKVDYLTEEFCSEYDTWEASKPTEDDAIVKYVEDYIAYLEENEPKKQDYFNEAAYEAVLTDWKSKEPSKTILDEDAYNAAVEEWKSKEPDKANYNTEEYQAWVESYNKWLLSEPKEENYIAYQINYHYNPEYVNWLVAEPQQSSYTKKQVSEEYEKAVAEWKESEPNKDDYYETDTSSYLSAIKEWEANEPQQKDYQKFNEEKYNSDYEVWENTKPSKDDSVFITDDTEAYEAAHKKWEDAEPDEADFYIEVLDEDAYKEAYEAWQDDEPQSEDYDSEEEYEDAHDSWLDNEPDTYEYMDEELDEENYNGAYEAWQAEEPKQSDYKKLKEDFYNRCYSSWESGEPDKQYYYVDDEDAYAEAYAEWESAEPKESEFKVLSAQYSVDYAEWESSEPAESDYEEEEVPDTEAYETAHANWENAKPDKDYYTELGKQDYQKAYQNWVDVEPAEFTGVKLTDAYETDYQDWEDAEPDSTDEEYQTDNPAYAEWQANEPNPEHNLFYPDYLEEHNDWSTEYDAYTTAKTTGDYSDIKHRISIGTALQDTVSEYLDSLTTAWEGKKPEPTDDDYDLDSYNEAIADWEAQEPATEVLDKDTYDSVVSEYIDYTKEVWGGSNDYIPVWYEANIYNPWLESEPTKAQFTTNDTDAYNNALAEYNVYLAKQTAAAESNNQNTSTSDASEETASEETATEIEARGISVTVNNRIELGWNAKFNGTKSVAEQTSIYKEQIDNLTDTNGTKVIDAIENVQSAFESYAKDNAVAESLLIKANSTWHGSSTIQEALNTLGSVSYIEVGTVVSPRHATDSFGNEIYAFGVIEGATENTIMTLYGVADDGTVEQSIATYDATTGNMITIFTKNIVAIKGYVVIPVEK